MDVARDVDGHILVVPKKHVKNILDCDVDTLSRIMDTVKRVSLSYACYGPFHKGTEKMDNLNE